MTATPLYPEIRSTDDAEALCLTLEGRIDVLETVIRAETDYLATARLAEAFAELLHKRVRREFWAYARDETLDNEAMIAEQYQGIRPAPGYPACPDHTEKAELFNLLNAPRAGISLTESFAMWPASSVSGFYLAHPQAQYFAVGKVARDQVESYAQRKGKPIEETQRWLAPVLGYDA